MKKLKATRHSSVLLVRDVDRGGRARLLTTHLFRDEEEEGGAKNQAQANMLLNNKKNCFSCPVVLPDVYLFLSFLSGKESTVCIFLFFFCARFLHEYDAKNTTYLVPDTGYLVCM